MRKQMTARDFIEEVKMIADLKHIPVKIDERYPYGVGFSVAVYPKEPAHLVYLIACLATGRLEHLQREVVEALKGGRLTHSPPGLYFPQIKTEDPRGTKVKP